MSIKISSLVWEHYPTGGGELLTALAYADHAHDDGSGIRPSVAYIARKTRQSERTIQMHLASMRKSGWLLTVRNATGGRGRATEYRVNPSWVANPADFAPFSETAERVQLEGEKGAIDSTKGCKAFAPQPSRTVGKPTTTCGAPGKTTAIDSGDLDWPVLFDGVAQVSASQILQNCPPEDRQNLLDEVAGLADRGNVRHPIGLLRKLVERAQQGQFVPAAALDHQRKRQSETRTIQTRNEEQQRRQQQSAPETQQAVRTHLARLRQQLTRKRPLIDTKEPS